MTLEQRNSSPVVRSEKLPWKCVSLENHRIIPLQQDGVLDANTLDSKALNDPSVLAQYNVCVHVETVPCCTLAIDQHDAQPLSHAVVSTDFHLYEQAALNYWARTQVIDASEAAEAINPLTFVTFSPQVQYPVQFSCANGLPSKLDPRYVVSQTKPLLGIYRNRRLTDQSILVVEQLNAHGCGQLTVYSFQADQRASGQKAAILEDQFTGLDYATLAPSACLSCYGIDIDQLQARTFSSTTHAVATLKRYIEQDRQAIDAGKVAYQYRADKLLVSFFAWTVGVNYYNAASWCVSVLTRANLLKAVRFDDEYRIPSCQSWGSRLFGTPDNALPLPELSSSHAVSSHGH